MIELHDIMPTLTNNTLKQNTPKQYAKTEYNNAKQEYCLERIMSKKNNVKSDYFTTNMHPKTSPTQEKK